MSRPRNSRASSAPIDVNTGALVWNWDSGNPDEHARRSPPARPTRANSPNSWSIMPASTRRSAWSTCRWATSRRTSGAATAAQQSSASPRRWWRSTSPRGQVRWVFQTVHHDLWDYDVPSQPSLIDLTIERRDACRRWCSRPSRASIFVLDRRDGAPLLPVTRGARAAGRGSRRPHRADAAGLRALLRPAAADRSRDMWGATIFDQLACRIAVPQAALRGPLHAALDAGLAGLSGQFRRLQLGRHRRRSGAPDRLHHADLSRLRRRSSCRAPTTPTLYVQQGGNAPEGSLPALNENFGAPFAAKLSAFTSPLGIPCQQPPWGYVAGADLTTGKLVWQHRNGTVRDLSPLPLPFRMGVPNLGGPIMTARRRRLPVRHAGLLCARLRRDDRRRAVGRRACPPAAKRRR